MSEFIDLDIEYEKNSIPLRKFTHNHSSLLGLKLGNIPHLFKLYLYFKLFRAESQVFIEKKVK